MRNSSFLFCALLALAGSGVRAHEFWMLPKTFAVGPGASAQISLAVGENFQGEAVAFSPALVAALRHYSNGKTTDLGAGLPAGKTLPELSVVLAQAGAHLIAFDTHPSQIVLPADKFHAYLHDEGLDFIIKQREAKGTAATPGRERFRRNTKTLLQAGGKRSSTHLIRTGQKLEIVPLSDPYAQASGKDLDFQILFDGRPLANALVKSWHRKGPQTLLIRTVSNAKGRVVVTPPWPGTWMVSVVHMVPVTDSADHDWDSYWGNLTFDLPRKR